MTVEMAKRPIDAVDGVEVPSAKKKADKAEKYEREALKREEKSESKSSPGNEVTPKKAKKAKKEKKVKENVEKDGSKLSQDAANVEDSAPAPTPEEPFINPARAHLVPKSDKEKTEKKEKKQFRAKKYEEKITEDAPLFFVDEGKSTVKNSEDLTPNGMLEVPTLKGETVLYPQNAVAEILEQMKKKSNKGLRNAQKIKNKQEREIAVAAAKEQIANPVGIENHKVQKKLRKWRIREDLKVEQKSHKEKRDEKLEAQKPDLDPESRKAKKELKKLTATSKKLEKSGKAIPEEHKENVAVAYARLEKLNKKESLKFSKAVTKNNGGKKVSSSCEDDELPDAPPVVDESGSSSSEDDSNAEEEVPNKIKDLKLNGVSLPVESKTPLPQKVNSEGKKQDKPTAMTSDNGYTQSPELSALPQSTIDDFLTKNFISITDPKSPTPSLRPITEFSFLPVSDDSQMAPFKSFANPTPIQSASWPYLLSGRDMVGVAETGSGKTLAFAVPCIRFIKSLPNTQKNKGAKAVVVSPTRELAMQIFEQIVKIATPAGIKAVCVYGGVPKEKQREDLKTAHIVVATPGRLNDLIQEGYADLSKVGYMVLDEADRMLDKGFEEAIRTIINQTLPQHLRQTLMFTATWPQSVRDLAGTFMNSPIKITIGDNPTGDLRANTRIAQTVEVVDPRGKEQRLLQLLKQYQSGIAKDDRILVFCLYKKEATRVEGFLRSKGLRVAGIHGDLSQQQRTESLGAFKSGKVPLLVATDVAARGLDIPAVKVVINLTFPLTVEDYVHRIGRTGRAGKEGIAVTLFTEHDKAQSGA
jgi:ATP-dependent RNA helicase DBP3